MDADRLLPRPPFGSVSIERDSGGQEVLYLRGDVDTAVATEFTRAKGRRSPVDAIDAAEVSFISSSGLAVMLLCAEASAAAGRPVVLRAASHVVDRAVRTAGIDRLFARPDPGGDQAPGPGTSPR